MSARELVEMKRVTGIALVAGLLLLFPQSLIPQSVFANTLVSTTPVAGAALQSAPSAVTITTELPLLDGQNKLGQVDKSVKFFKVFHKMSHFLMGVVGI